MFSVGVYMYDIELGFDFLARAFLVSHTSCQWSLSMPPENVRKLEVVLCF